MSSINLTEKEIAALLKDVRTDLVAHLIREFGPTVQLLSASQVCGLLDVTPKKLGDLKLPRVVLGPGTVKYRLSDLAAFIESRIER